MADFYVREMLEADLPALYDIQTDAAAQFMAAFTDTTNDRDKYLQKWRRILDDDTVSKKVVVVEGDVVGSVASFVIDGDTEVTCWIRRGFWGRGLATKALTTLLKEVPTRPVFARAAHDNVGSARVLERNGFVQVDTEQSFAEARGGDTIEAVFRLG